jgi:hypothetical protein
MLFWNLSANYKFLSFDEFFEGAKGESLEVADRFRGLLTNFLFSGIILASF